RASQVVGCAPSQDQRLPTTIATIGPWHVDGCRQFWRRLRHFPGYFGRRILFSGTPPLRRVSPPRDVIGPRRQERRALRRATGDRFPGNLATTAGAARPQ